MPFLSLALTSFDLSMVVSSSPLSQVNLNYFLLFPVRRKILSILDSIDFSQEIPEPLQLDFFDRVQIEQVIANCEHKNLRGQTVCNVKVRMTFKCVQTMNYQTKIQLCNYCFLIEILVYWTVVFSFQIAEKSD